MIYLSGTPVHFDNLKAFWQFLDITTSPKYRSPAENRLVGQSLTAVRLGKSFVAVNSNTNRWAILDGTIAGVFLTESGVSVVNEACTLQLQWDSFTPERAGLDRKTTMVEIPFESIDLSFLVSPK